MATAYLLPPVTPVSYHRIISPTFKISEAVDQTLPVGILSCQRDPLLFTLDTNIISCSVHQPPPEPASAKKAKKGAPPAPKPESVHPTLEIITHDTIIFPEGGGQPSDIGTMTTANGTAWDVTQCRRHGGHAVHYVRVKDAIRDMLNFPAGAKVTVALGSEGFNRRYDHMTMHTGQHMLSALLQSNFKLPTLSWSLTAYPTPCYIDVGRAMTSSEIATIQDEANKLVFEGRSVYVEVEEVNRPAESKASTPAPAELPSGYLGKAAMPVDYTGGVNRVVSIEGIDRTPCCGTHLPTLHNLQVFLLPHTDSSGRLYFVSGPRLIEYVATSHTLLANASAAMNVGAPSVPERVIQIVDERRKALKRVEDLELEIAEQTARSLVGEMAAQAEGVFSKHIHRTDDSPAPLPFLTNVSKSFMEDPASKNGKYLIVMSSSPSIQSLAASSVILVFGSDDGLVKAAGESLKATGIKGGGKGPKWSGKFTGAWKDGPQVVEEALKVSLGA